MGAGELYDTAATGANPVGFCIMSFKHSYKEICGASLVSRSWTDLLLGCGNGFETKEMGEPSKDYNALIHRWLSEAGVGLEVYWCC